MTGYTAPIDDLQFVLHDLLRISEADIPGYAEIDREVSHGALVEAGRLASNVLAPLNVVGDTEGCRFENGVVRTPAGFREAFDRIRLDGWTAIDCDPQDGGQGLPYLLHTVVQECFVSANMALQTYHGLTHGAYSAIRRHGTEAQRRTYLPKLARCDWTGTMNLTEPQCGTDLGLLRSRAEPQPDGSYRITGTKIFISAGDHDMAENVIHLVLARIPGAPEGIKGVSLFIVPRYLVGPDGAPGAANALRVGRIERKMGLHGSATCEMVYDGATGFLLGEAHKGMRAMFTMMNEARLGVGLQGYAVAEAAYQQAADWARTRLQGRAVDGPEAPELPADPIIVHPDIRRSLMEQRSFIEGARAFTLWGAMLIDRAQRMEDAQAHGLVSLLTPVIKGFLTDKGFEATVAAQQVLGGHGYVEDAGMSQFVRDARIAMIYEGANGVQALDLVGRKLALDGGAHVRGLLAEVKGFMASAAGDPDMEQRFLGPLGKAVADFETALGFFMTDGTKEPRAALAGATDFLHLTGHLCLGYLWARMARAAQGGESAFLRTKLATGRFYMARQLPATGLHLARILTGAGPVMALQAEAF
ncbi:MAG: acyl-CoA dehydrogenase C-terminal domain-containing protein [Rubellimicrobium sp.]|nr:acyl-CoA dehydrogenase C-terminal domain-containing protein [Rubellimicrobium sp.]